MDRQPKKVFSFGEFEVDAVTRRLTRSGETLTINAKAFDVLVYLAANAGRVVSKDELLSAVWEDHFVEEANLPVQISALRRVLGDRVSAPEFILTVPGRGYEFIGEIDPPDEIIITDHKISSIVVEETITDDDEVRTRTPAVSGSLFKLLSGALTVVVIVGSAFWLYRARTNATPRKELVKHVFPTSGGTPFQAAISPDGRSIAYAAQLKGQPSLRIGNIENGTSIEIMPASDRIYQIVKFSPDGKDLYFTYRDANHLNAALMRISVLGGPPRELTERVDGQITFSPDGKFIAFIRREPDLDKSAIVIADAATGRNERELLTRGDADDIIGFGVSWSPNGSMIAFSGLEPGRSGSTVFTANVTDGTVTEIASVDNRIVNVAWLPDQSGLVLNRNTSNGANDGQIWFLKYPDGDLQNLSNDTLNYSIGSLSISSDNKVVVATSHTDPEIWVAPGGDVTRARLILKGSWPRREGMSGLSEAPDGKILFLARSGGGRTIWEMDSNGQNQRQLTASNNNSNDEQVGVTADDRTLIFQSDRSGRSEIWRANRDGTDLKQLTDGTDASEPSLIPNENGFVFVRHEDGKSTLWRASIDGGPPSQITTEETSWPTVSPDGKFVACAYGNPISSVYKQIALIPLEGGPLRLFPVPPRAALYNRPTWSTDGKSILYKDETEGLWKQQLNAETPELIIGIDDFRFNYLSTSATDLIYSGGIIKRDIVLIENFR